MNLPIEMVNKIMSYWPIIKYRNGRWIKQISPDDMRYKILKCINEKTHYDGDFISFVNFYKKERYGQIQYSLFIFMYDNIVRYTLYKSRENNAGFLSEQSYVLT